MLFSHVNLHFSSPRACPIVTYIYRKINEQIYSRRIIKERGCVWDPFFNYLCFWRVFAFTYDQSRKKKERHYRITSFTVTGAFSFTVGPVNEFR